MSEITGLSDIDVCARLRENAALAKFRVQQTRENKKKIDALTQRINELKRALERIEGRQTFIRRNVKYLKSFVEKKRTKAINGVHASIYNTNQILPSTGKIDLVIDRGEAYLNGENGEDVNLCEASSWRATSSVHIRRAILANTDYAQVMVLDEPLAVLDDYSSADFSLFLEPLSQDCQIILIEQKDSVFSNTDVATYLFEKIGDVTHVRRVANGATLPSEE